jgi:uncharacterized protein YecE (DUF72 family)
MAHVGTSGWSYDHWEGLLYPEGFDSLRRLHAYAAAFSTTELHVEHHHWPRHGSFAAWRQDTPEGFALSLVAGSGPADGGGLSAPEAWAAHVAAAWADLGPRRGMVLAHLHPALQRDDARLEAFLSALPDDVSVAVEMRDASWHTDGVFDLLERHGAAYCVMDGAGLPTVLRTTAERVYLRLHGPDHGAHAAGSYYDDDLRAWADRVRAWEDDGHEVFAYFGNDVDGHAVRNAGRLVELLV